MQQTILSLENLSFTYPGDHYPVLSDISLTLKEGEITLLCGASGCGKSTLLSHMKKDQIPFGTGSGRILFEGQELETMSDLDSARRIGYVGQDPDSGIVTDRVWHELAFGLENLGVPTDEIRRRIAEISEYCGITSWFDKDINQLSGGQKQILNLA
ncbi:MAG: ABC transporter ATP-binding protein, partial [Lachnospiraceae bacterium]|nr:ABC transporter ATP-binding protein [Lachnospiraceae bacterium]